MDETCDGNVALGGERQLEVVREWPWCDTERDLTVGAVGHVAVDGEHALKYDRANRRQL